jgi:hypothetical protein
MDNLPLMSVVDYLQDPRGGRGPRYPRRPEKVPHLILAASLEPEPENWESGELSPSLEERCESWQVLRRRASELRYNRKIDEFADAQRNLRRILEIRFRAGETTPDDPALPLDLEVAVVKSKWLCDSFAFHPMLGFRREDQAASIAHGCAATFQMLSDLFHAWPKPGEPPARYQERKALAEARQAWAREKAIDFEQLGDNRQPRESSEVKEQRGLCWYRRGRGTNGEAPRCPFAKEVVLERETASPDEAARLSTMADELDAIYRACGQAKTHQRR